MKKICLTVVLAAVTLLCSAEGVTGHHARKSRFMSYKGLALAGYQGWFNAEGDGAGRGWNHYYKGRLFEPGACTIDAWPDVSEYDKVYPTSFVNADGTPAKTFSSYDRSTTDLHFKWMKQYGVDGVFMQRFVVSVKSKLGLAHTNVVLENALRAATKYDRAICVMYDLSGMKAEDMQIVKDDWRALVKQMKLTSRRNNHYLYHNGKPLIAIWGVGFGGGRKYGYEEIQSLIDFFKNDEECGGCSILLGVPTYWRTLGRDTNGDPRLWEMIRQCDIVHPWHVGRYNSPESFLEFSRNIAADMEWCKREHLDYVPVVWPGFSWHNMQYPEDKTATLNKIPRLKGKFFWTQIARNVSLGATMFYYAMFDEIDEGTAIFKITNTPPVGASKFIDNDHMPSDWYLRLAGEGARMLRKEIPYSEDIPIR